MNRRTFTFLGVLGSSYAVAQEKARPKPDPSRLMFHESDVIAKIKKLIVDHLEVDEKLVTENARFLDDLGADSLDVVELTMAFEDAFGIKIPDAQAEKMIRVSDAIAIVKRALAAQSRLIETRGKG